MCLWIGPRIPLTKLYGLASMKSMPNNRHCSLAFFSSVFSVLKYILACLKHMLLCNSVPLQLYFLLLWHSGMPFCQLFFPFSYLFYFCFLLTCLLLFLSFSFVDNTLYYLSFLTAWALLGFPQSQLFLEPAFLLTWLLTPF